MFLLLQNGICLSYENLSMNVISEAAVYVFARLQPDKCCRDEACLIR